MKDTVFFIHFVVFFDDSNQLKNVAIKQPKIRLCFTLNHCLLYAVEPMVKIAEVRKYSRAPSLFTVSLS